MAPQNNMQDEINALIQIQHRREEYNRLIMEMEEEGRTEDATQLRNLRDNYLRDKLGEFPIREIDLEVSRPFPGLDELANKELVVEDIGYNEFVRTVGGLITDVQDDYLANVLEKIYQTHFKGRGRPRNMLVVCRHDPKLRGYTEFFSVGDLEMIAQRISSITQDVSRFLGALDGVRS
jgi:hypothetical protein